MSAMRVLVTDEDGTMVDAWEVDTDDALSSIEAARAAVCELADRIRQGVE